MKERNDGEDEIDLEDKLKKRPNPCIGCPVWEKWKFTLSKQEQKNPCPIVGIVECYICPDK